MIILDENHYFEYVMIGEFNSYDSWTHPCRVIDSYELLFVTAGTVYLEEDGTRYTLSANQSILLEPGKTHGGYLSSTKHTSFYWFHFHSDLGVPLKTYCGSAFYDLKYLLKKLLHITNKPNCDPHAADAIGLSIFYELADRNSDYSLPGTMLANRIAEYVRINCKNDISVSDIAQKFDYTPDYIGKCFFKIYHVRLKEYIANEKMKAAKDLLLSTSLSVKQIAAELGYAQSNLFIKFFSYHEGLSPTAFRNQFSFTHMNNK